MLSKSSLRRRDQVNCDETQMFVIKQAEFLQIEPEIDVGVSRLIPPSIVVFSCSSENGVFQHEEIVE